MMHRQSLRKLKASFVLSHGFEHYVFYPGLAQRPLGVLLSHLQSACDREGAFLGIVTRLEMRPL